MYFPDDKLPDEIAFWQIIIIVGMSRTAKLRIFSRSKTSGMLIPRFYNKSTLWKVLLGSNRNLVARIVLQGGRSVMLQKFWSAP